jgi:hypothetical protein
MAALATFAQIQLEKETSTLNSYASDNIALKGRNLKGYQSYYEDDSNDVDYRDLL